MKIIIGIALLLLHTLSIAGTPRIGYVRQALISPTCLYFFPGDVGKKDWALRVIAWSLGDIIFGMNFDGRDLKVGTPMAQPAAFGIKYRGYKITILKGKRSPSPDGKYFKEATNLVITDGGDTKRIPITGACQKPTNSKF